MSRTTSAHRARTTTSRIRTAITNVLVDGWSKCRKYCIRGYQTAASTTIHSSTVRQRAIASTASGTSHSEYCGLHTLFVTRNPATTRNVSDATRGRRGAVTAITATATQTTAHTTRATA